MSLGELLLKMGPVLVAGAIAYFIYASNPRQRTSVFLAWLVPGLGHWWAGHRSRAMYFAACLIPTFFIGLILADFRNISPFDRHPIWGLAQLPGGLLTALTWLATNTLKGVDNPAYHVGCLYTGSACLLNIIAMCDVWDLTEKADARAKATESTAEARP
jgi:hypothetical protein